MKSIKVTPKALSKAEKSEMMKTYAKSTDAEILIDYEAILHQDGKLIAAYKKYEGDLKTLLYACEAIGFSKSKRTNGMPTFTKSIGHIPRNPRRVNACQPSELLVSKPILHDIFVHHAQIIAGSYKKFFRKAYQHQEDDFINGEKPVDSAYLIEDTPFTSGVINKDNALHYHFDNANTPDGMSCMIILKNNVNGGELALPELNIRFACQNGYMLLFDGQKYLHGVTRIVKARGGYRYTVVYYNNRGMSLCLPPTEEYLRYKKLMDRKVTEGLTDNI